jgi:hypothetical protein
VEAKDSGQVALDWKECTMKKYETDIPQEVYLRLLPLFYAMRKVSAVDVRRPSVADLLGRKSLREWLGHNQQPIIVALKWALTHPDKDYRVFLQDDDRLRFTNQDCLKMLGLFLRSFEHLDDDGPDIVEPVDLAEYLERYPDGNYPPPD